MAGIILSVDIGTSSLKAAFINLSGKLLAFSRTAYTFDSKGRVNASAWERAFVLALEKLHEAASGCVADCICISGNGPTLVPLTHSGESLPPLYWHGGKTVLPGGKQTPSFFLPYVAWFKKNAPDEYKKTKLFISSHEWLARRLGAEELTVLPSSAYEPYYWDDEQCRLFDLDRKKFPPFVKMGEQMGRVSPEAAARLSPFSGASIKEGTPVIAGGPDFITALIGTAALRPGTVCDRAGSSEGVNVCAAAPPSDTGSARGGVRILPHAKEGLWNIGAVIPASGKLFESYREFTRRENQSYEELLAELIPSADDTEIFNGAFFFPPASAQGGGSESFKTAVQRSGLSEEKTSLGRAVLCAIGFSVRSAIETLSALGFPLGEMNVSGGQGKNSRWNQLKADISGVSLFIPEIVDGELAGNAVLAAASLEGGGLEETAARLIRFREVFRPRKETASFWEQRYKDWTYQNARRPFSPEEA